MKKVKQLAVLNFVFFVIAFAVSNLSQSKIFGGVTNADISNKYPTVFTPAGITFAIWGLIYLSLFGFTIYHLIKAYQADEQAEANQTLLKIGNLFIINNIATTFWVFAFAYEFLLLSMILIVIQLITLLLISIRLNIFDVHKSFNNKLFTQFPLSIYFSWLCVATIANISVYLVSIGFKGNEYFGENEFAMVLVIIAILISFFITTVKRNPFFGLVTVWALYGIQLKRRAIDADQFEFIIKFCFFGIITLTLAAILQWLINLKTSKKRQQNNA
jgi:hypothetical protein